MNFFQKIIKIISPSQRSYSFYLMWLMLVGMILETIGIGVIMPALSLMSENKDLSTIQELKPLLEYLNNPTAGELLAIFMILLVVFFIIKTIFLIYLSFSQNKFVFGLQESISKRLFSVYLHQSYEFHLERNSAELVRNVIGEVQQLTGVFSAGLIFITELLVLLGITTLLFFIEPVGATIVALVLGLTGFTFDRYTKRYIKQWGEDRQYHEGLRMKHLHQGLYCAKDIKLLGREGYFVRQYNIHNSGAATMGKNQSVLQSMPKLWLELLAIIGLSSLVLSMLLQGKQIDSIIPILGVFGAAAFRLMPSINRLINTSQVIRYFVPVVNTIYNELTNINNKNKGNLGKGDLSFKKNICIDSGVFKYQSSNINVINNVSLCIKKGSTVGFIGGTGSGKSTLIDIILGFLPLMRGCVKVDGVNIDVNVDSWQSKIGYIPQDIYLIDDTLKKNIAFGIDDDLIDNSAIIRAVNLAKLEDFIDNLSDGLETIIGEDGARLSGGQRQRIGIARALYHNPQVLVLDEATSALDVNTEKEVMQAINNLHGDKTIIIIAHRLSTISQCDYVYEIEHGRVIKEGSFSEVVN
jgi:ATP-binding cassette, subfamily B, bacterial PglK